MCGRYSLTSRLDQLLPRLWGGLPDGLADHYGPRPLIRPGDPVLALRQEHGRSGAALLLWGLLPDWSRDPLRGPRPFNARSESVAEKASFRGAWRHRRCLLPADGFWEKGRLIRRRDRAPFWLAALWERWIGPDGSEVESCCSTAAARPHAGDPSRWARAGLDGARRWPRPAGPAAAVEWLESGRLGGGAARHDRTPAAVAARLMVVSARTDHNGAAPSERP
jgi:hypothetical protein